MEWKIYVFYIKMEYNIINRNKQKINLYNNRKENNRNNTLYNRKQNFIKKSY